MPSSALSRPLVLAVPLALAGLLTGCGGDDAASGTSTEVAVAAGDETCELDRTELEAGRVTFAVTNEGGKVTEVYVYGESGGAYTKVVSEVENIGPGTSRDMVVDLGAGTYEIACKPGQTGDGIRQQVTVTGSGGEEATSESGYDREVELSVDDSTLSGLDDATAEAGERIEFKLENTTDSERVFEVFNPAGDEVSEFEVAAGEEGEAIVELSEAGEWTLKVERGPSEIEETLTVG
jgi:uncharacterized cupredoxin-like copper-binding protein